MAHRKPNILWICTDQQRFDTLRIMGNRYVRTPNLDKLAKEGVIFTSAYTQSPVCTPSRASFLTGCYPSRIHVNRNGNEYFPENVPLLPRILADNGYDCGLAGKLHLAGAEGRVEPRVNDGYRVFKWSHDPRPMDFWPLEHHAYQRWLKEEGIDFEKEYGVKVDKTWEFYEFIPSRLPPSYHQTTWCVNEAIRFICQKRKEPWLMSVNIFDPHPPFDPPKEYMQRMRVDKMPLPVFREEELDSQLAFSGVDHQTESPRSPHEYDARRMVAAYYAQIELLDDQIGRLVEKLKETDQWENTIIIFMSDHGDMLGDHGLLFKGCRFYEGAVHVPLIICWPGHFKRGVRSEALVELVDIMPTLLEAANLPVPEYVQGKSLLPLLEGEKSPGQHRPFVRCEYHDALKKPHHTHANMIFDGRYKLTVYHGLQVGELYDLQEDPHELHNLWNETSAEEIKYELMKSCFDARMLSVNIGPPRIGRY